jgi:hypothetical protein
MNNDLISEIVPYVDTNVYHRATCLDKNWLQYARKYNSLKFTRKLMHVGEVCKWGSWTDFWVSSRYNFGVNINWISFIELQYLITYKNFKLSEKELTWLVAFGLAQSGGELSRYIEGENKLWSIDQSNIKVNVADPSQKPGISADEIEELVLLLDKNGHNLKFKDKNPYDVTMIFLYSGGLSYKIVEILLRHNELDTAHMIRCLCFSIMYDKIDIFKLLLNYTNKLNTKEIEYVMLILDSELGEKTLNPEKYNRSYFSMMFFRHPRHLYYKLLLKNKNITDALNTKKIYSLALDVYKPYVLTSLLGMMSIMGIVTMKKFIKN